MIPNRILRQRKVKVKMLKININLAKKTEKERKTPCFPGKEVLFYS